MSAISSKPARQSFGYVVRLDGPRVTLNLLDSHTGQQASHRYGVSPVAEVGSLFAIDGGVRLLIARVLGLHFAEPREAHREGVGTSALNAEPLRHLEAVVQGYLERKSEDLKFTQDFLVSPTLGAGAYPLTPDETRTILRSHTAEATDLVLGTEPRTGIELKANLQDLLPRHMAVLGATGQGKSSFTAAVLQQILELPTPRVVVFDINGEYSKAVEDYVQGDELVSTRLGGENPDLRIPYYALGRHGLSRLFLPSERTQRPALNFALDALSFVEWHKSVQGAGLVGSRRAVLFDDCRSEGATEAAGAINRLRSPTDLVSAGSWPPMRALACLVAESHSIVPKGGGLQRDTFLYQNVSPLITRILRRADDPQFRAVVDVSGGRPPQGRNLDWLYEGSRLVDRIFGEVNPTWKLHLVNLREVAHDLLPLVLGSLLELYAFELFRRGQDTTYPTMLVLEEAHHYLRQIVPESEEASSTLAYERLAKEGRKFGVALWLSTQRPSEVSPTVLGQCGTWATFRLVAEQDLRAIASASEWVDRQELNRIAGLRRQDLLLFGAGVSLPIRLVAATANPPPRSRDPNFAQWAASGGDDTEEIQEEDTFPLDATYEDEDIPF